MPRIPRMATYALVSTTLFSTVIFSALHSRPNFYSASVAVGRSSGAMMVLGNFALFLSILLGMGVKKLFFGQLRRVEYEHLFERLWLFLTESLLALTIFRDDFSAPFAIMYGVLVFLKCFHWITADRVDYMDQVPPPGPPVLFHIRAIGIITLLTTLDLLLVMYSLETILANGVSAMVLFGSEYLILLASIWGTGARYAVNVIDIRRARGRADAPSWEEKSMWLFYIDLAVDFAKLLTYLSFFAVILMNYGIPLHILRDVWMTFRSFLSRCSDLIRYRRATRDMDAQYPDATEEDVGRLGDRVCIICREEMVVRGQAHAGAASGSEGNNAGPGTEQGHVQGITADGQGQGDASASGTGSTAEDASQAQPLLRPTPTRPLPAETDAGGPNETPKKLICGHVFHFHCLRSWLERQQSCPTCRRDVLARPATMTRNSFNRPHQPEAAAAADGAVPAPPAPGAVPQNGQANLPAAQATPAPTGPTGANGPAPAPAAPTTPAEAMRAQWNHYFRMREVNGAVPTPTQPQPTAAPVPAPGSSGTSGTVGAATMGPSAGAGGSAAQSTLPSEDESIQRSIWGGPIQPGRFFPSPLGAIRLTQPSGIPGPQASHIGLRMNGSGASLSTNSRWVPQQVPSNGDSPNNSGPSRVLSPNRLAPEPGFGNMARPHLQPSRTVPRPPSSPERGRSQAASFNLNSSSLSTASSPSTPLSSQAPDIFRSTGDSPPPSEVEVSSSVPDHSNSTEAGESNGTSINDVRRAAAEAAMRRSGVRETKSKSQSLELPTRSNPSGMSSSVGPGTVPSATSSLNVNGSDPSLPTTLSTFDKGKGKAREFGTDTAGVAATEAKAGPARSKSDANQLPDHVPFLTPVQLPPPHVQSQSLSAYFGSSHIPQQTWGRNRDQNWSSAKGPVAAGQHLPGTGNGNTPSSTIRALDERLKALRDVDEVIWGLVGDLTRMRSQWEDVESGVGVNAGRSEGDGVGSVTSALEPGVVANDEGRLAVNDEGEDSRLGGKVSDQPMSNEREEEDSRVLQAGPEQEVTGETEVKTAEQE